MKEFHIIILSLFFIWMLIEVLRNWRDWDVGGGIIGIFKHQDLSSKGIHIPMKMGFFVPISIYYWVIMVFSKGETNGKNFTTDDGMVNLPLHWNNHTDFMCDWMEVVVEKFMRTEPMSTIDFLIITILFTMVIYLFNYIRKKKWWIDSRNCKNPWMLRKK